MALAIRGLLAIMSGVGYFCRKQWRPADASEISDRVGNQEGQAEVSEGLRVSYERGTTRAANKGSRGAGNRSRSGP